MNMSNYTQHLKSKKLPSINKRLGTLFVFSIYFPPKNYIISFVMINAYAITSLVRNIRSHPE